MTDWLEVAEARRRLIDGVNPLKREIVPLSRAAGRILAQAISAPFDLPQFANSSMDGFAVRVLDVAAASREQPIELRVVGDIAAGSQPSFTLSPGQAARIMTGAPLPGGAEAVVPVEETDQFGFSTGDEPPSGLAAPQTVKIYRPSADGAYVRLAGQDVQRGETVLQAGRRIQPQVAGFLGMLGVADVPVFRQPRVAVFSSGDELLPVGAGMAPGKIYDSNTSMLVAQVAQAGGLPDNLGIVPDQVEKVQAVLDRAANQGVDLILSSAGVSVGAFDFVRRVLEEHGRLDFWRVNMRPGKPIAVGRYHDILFVGLPGNPVSAFVGFEVFVRPLLARLAGLSDWQRPRLQVQLLEPVESDGRETYLRAIISRQDDQWAARLVGHQGSGNLRALVEANALLVIPSGVKCVPASARIEAWLLDEFI